MRKIGYLICVLVVLSLPCIEVSEFSGLCEDTSNDFVLVSLTTRRSEVVRQPEFRPSQIDSTNMASEFPRFDSKPVWQSPYFNGSTLLILICTQKK